MLELYNNFFTKFWDVNKFEESEMDTDPLYLALAEKELEDWHELNWKQSGSNCGQKILPIVILLIQSEISSPEYAVTSTKNMTSESLVFSKRNSGVRKCCAFVVKLPAATKLPLTIWNSASKDSISEWNRVVMALWKSIAKFLMREWTLHLQTEVSEQRITQMQLMKEPNEDCHTFILVE